MLRIGVERLVYKFAEIELTILTNYDWFSVRRFEEDEVKKVRPVFSKSTMQHSLFVLAWWFRILTYGHCKIFPKQRCRLQRFVVLPLLLHKSEVRMDSILDFLHPDSCCLQQDQECCFLCFSWNQIGFGFCVCCKKTYWLFAWLLFIRNEIGFGLSSWYRILNGNGFKICKKGLDPDSKKSEYAQL